MKAHRSGNKIEESRPDLVGFTWNDESTKEVSPVDSKGKDRLRASKVAPMIGHDCSLKIEETEWLTSKEAAEYLRISEGTLRNMTSNGKIPYGKLGRSNRYRRDDLRELILSNKGGSYGN